MPLSLKVSQNSNILNTRVATLFNFHRVISIQVKRIAINHVASLSFSAGPPFVFIYIFLIYICIINIICNRIGAGLYIIMPRLYGFIA